MSSFMKIRSVGAELFHVGGQTEGRTEMDGRTETGGQRRTDRRTDRQT